MLKFQKVYVGASDVPRYVLVVPQIFAVYAAYCKEIYLVAESESGVIPVSFPV